MGKIETKYIAYVIVSLIIGLSIVGYGYLNYKAKREALNQQLFNDLSKSLDDQSKQKQLQVCLDEVNNRVSGVYKDKSTNSLTVKEVEVLLEAIQKQKDECFRKYPQK